MTNHVTLRLDTWAASVGLLQYAAKVSRAPKSITGLPKAQEGDKRGIAHVGGIQERPIVHCFSTNVQHQQQHEVRDEAAG